MTRESHTALIVEKEKRTMQLSREQGKKRIGQGM